MRLWDTGAQLKHLPRLAAPLAELGRASRHRKGHLFPRLAPRPAGHVAQLEQPGHVA